MVVLGGRGMVPVMVWQAQARGRVEGGIFVWLGADVVGIMDRVVSFFVLRERGVLYCECERLEMFVEGMVGKSWVLGRGCDFGEGKGSEEICVCYKSNSVWGLTANTVIEQKRRL